MFTFKLAAALAQRRKDEDRAWLALTRVQTFANEIATECGQLTHELSSLRTADIRLTAARTTWILERRARAGAAQKAVDTELARARSAVAAAAAARRGLEVLEARQRAVYEQRLARLEAQELDESNALRSSSSAGI